LAKVLLDSDVLIEWLRGHEPVVTQVLNLVNDHAELFWTPISIAEIFAGARKGEEDAIGLHLLLEPVPITADIGRQAGQYLKSYNRSHAVELAYALIAACATVEGLALWTRNKKHYPMKDVQFFS